MYHTDNINLDSFVYNGVEEGSKMMVHDLRKKTTALLLCLLIGSSIFAAPTDAKPKNDPKLPVKHAKQVHHEKHKNCGDIVRDVLRADRHDFDRACHAGMTLEDLLLPNILPKVLAVILQIFSVCRKMVSLIKKFAKLTELIGAVCADI